VKSQTSILLSILYISGPKLNLKTGYPFVSQNPSGKDIRVVHLRLGSSSFLPHPVQFTDH